jgi:hypothetical protein
MDGVSSKVHPAVESCQPEVTQKKSNVCLTVCKVISIATLVFSFPLFYIGATKFESDPISSGLMIGAAFSQVTTSVIALYLACTHRS